MTSSRSPRHPAPKYANRVVVLSSTRVANHPLRTSTRSCRAPEPAYVVPTSSNSYGQRASVAQVRSPRDAKAIYRRRDVAGGLRTICTFVHAPLRGELRPHSDSTGLGTIDRRHGAGVKRFDERSCPAAQELVKSFELRHAPACHPPKRPCRVQIRYEGLVVGRRYKLARRLLASARPLVVSRLPAPRLAVLQLRGSPSYSSDEASADDHQQLRKRFVSKAGLGPCVGQNESEEMRMRRRMRRRREEELKKAESLEGTIGWWGFLYTFQRAVTECMPCQEFRMEFGGAGGYEMDPEY
ncbi:hypothetical protein CVT26_004399 [Gymnopilus dilepis]|uniref:Uncharacterized protein n=1 Tax=Gymnopilus dilepis TaxID=231916 RepID=A0A409WY78_9AGAR|nr:hypothetical protein CVT26_004399 [Gymnopilus dilepis]